MGLGRIQKVIELFQQSFELLGAPVPLDIVEKLSIMIHKAMTLQTRNYHNLSHVYALSDPTNPIQTLAALFHDIVYFQADRGFTPEIYQHIFPYIIQQGDEFHINAQIDKHDRITKITLAVFGFKPGQKLSPFTGLNELLSALVMNKCLDGFIPEKELLKITGCIEVTIPFRGINNKSLRPPEVLEKRLLNIVDQYKIAMTPSEVEDAIKHAVNFANTDLENFSEEDPGIFLDNTWKLLPETNVPLRSQGIYSIKDYRQALRKTEVFMSVLNPDDIFLQYKQVPSKKTYKKLVMQAHKNVNAAREYLGIKLIAIAVIEALADLTGGDAPLTLFTGDMQPSGKYVEKMGDYLPQPIISSEVDRNSTIYKLLEWGRASETSFDLKNSPLALFIYSSLGPENTMKLVQVAKEMFDGKLDAQEFLNHIDKSTVSAIAKASSMIVTTRSEALLRFC